MTLIQRSTIMPIQKCLWINEMDKNKKNNGSISNTIGWFESDYGVIEQTIFKYIFNDDIKEVIFNG